MVKGYNCQCISIHALREEGDLISDSDRDLGDKFLSTPSARRATLSVRQTKAQQ